MPKTYLAVRQISSKWDPLTKSSLGISGLVEVDIKRFEFIL